MRGLYEDILTGWSRARQWRQSAKHRHQWPSRQSFLEEFGSYNKNPEFWQSIDPYTYTDDINTPIQLHHGTGDTHVPIEFSETFERELKNKGKTVEFFTYEGADHNLSGITFGSAMQRSVEFFDKHLKQ